MTIPEEIRKRLKRLGFKKLDPQTIWDIAKHLQSGKTEWELYKKIKVGAIEKTITSRKSVQNVKAALKAGLLDFFVNHPDGISGLWSDAIKKNARTDKPEVKPDPADPIGSRRREVLDDATAVWIDTLKRWDVVSLQELGFQNDDAVRILSEYDQYRYVEEQNLFTDPNLERLAVVYNIVVFKGRYFKAPYKHLDLAARLYVSGRLINDQALGDAGIDLLRYAVWDGEKNMDAFHTALTRHHRTERQLDTLKSEIRNALGGEEDSG